jgi:hypothetical protein
LKVRDLWRRLARLLGRSRIRLPRRPPAPGDLRDGDRLQIGPAVWVIRGSLPLPGGSRAFHLEAAGEESADARRALLLTAETAPWTLVRGDRRVELPPGCVGVYAVRNPGAGAKAGGAAAISGSGQM